MGGVVGVYKVIRLDMGGRGWVVRIVRRDVKENGSLRFVCERWMVLEKDIRYCG
jgi:hypothetical protein